MLSPTVPKLARFYQSTFTIHCLAQTGDVVLQSAMQGNKSISMCPAFLFCMMTGIDYIDPNKETDNSFQKFIGVLVCPSYFDHTGGRGGAYVSSFQKGRHSIVIPIHLTKLQGIKIDYLPLSILISLQPHVIASVARLQRQEVSK
jgi:hypothetical protein